MFLCRPVTRATLVLGILSLGLGLGLGSAVGQVPELPWPFLNSNATETNVRSPTETVLLRPNVEEVLYLYVHNPTDRKYDLTVGLAAGPNDGDEFANATVSVPAKATARVLPPKPPADKPIADKPPPLTALPNGLFLRLSDMDNRDQVRVFKLSTSVRIPSEYVRSEVTIDGEPGMPGHRLMVRLHDRDPIRPFAGPPAKVRLQLTPELAPGVVPESAVDGTYQGELPPGLDATLVAANLRFRGPERSGVVAVSIDGIDRAFLFHTDFAGRNPTEIREPRLHLAAPEYALPGKPCPVRLEVDNAPFGADVEFGIDRANTGNFERTRFRSGARDESVGVRWANGGLTFVTAVRDRVVNLDTAGMHGPRKLRLRLLNPREQDRDIVPPKDIVIVFDGSPPEVKSFGPAPKQQIVRGGSVLFAAEVGAPKSGVKSVVFFLGEPPGPDGKGPPGSRAIVAVPPTSSGGTYTATMPLPDSKGRVQVGLRVTSNAGLIKDVTESIDVADPPPKPTTGSIKVTVVQGSESRPQPGLEVQLRDEKKQTVVDAGRTNDKGELTFKTVAPGKYVVSSIKPRDGNAKAEKLVTVEAGKTEEVTLSLKR